MSRFISGDPCGGWGRSLRCTSTILHRASGSFGDPQRDRRGSDKSSGPGPPATERQTTRSIGSRLRRRVEGWDVHQEPPVTLDLHEPALTASVEPYRV